MAAFTIRHAEPEDYDSSILLVNDIAFHRSMGFEVLPGYGDGPGQSRVRLRKRI